MTVTRSEYPESIADPLPTDETDRTIASDKVEGTAVFDAKDNKIGTIRSLMIDKISGHVEYAVMSFGGFLRIGERHHALPWKVLRYDEKLQGYVVGIKKETLASAPSFPPGAQPRFDDRYAASVYTHYGLAF